MADIQGSYTQPDMLSMPPAPQDDEGRNLIVNYVPISLTPAAFRNLFARFGEMEQCKLIMDRVTNLSAGYGFVKFTTIEAAKNAIEGMNGQMVENKVIKVSVAKRPDQLNVPAGIPAPQINANLYVAFLPKHYTKVDLEQIFGGYGPVVETKILTDPTTGGSRGVGFVRYETRAQAQNAVDSLNGHIPQGAENPITVKFSDTKEDKVRKGKMSPAFSNFGKALRYNPIGTPPGYSVGGYNVYQTQGIQPPLPPGMGIVPGLGMHHSTVGGGYTLFPPTTSAPQPGLSGLPSSSFAVFVYNLPQDTDESLMYRIFGPFGAISDAKVIRSPENGLCKGYGFVHYLKMEDAQQAILSMNGYQLGQKFLQVSFKKNKSG